MSSKTIVGFVAFLCAVGILAEENKSCSSQEECTESQCCSKDMYTQETYCMEKRKLNEACQVGHMMINGLYANMCPCDGNMDCIKEEYRTHSGRSYSIGNARCRESTSADTIPPAKNDYDDNTDADDDNTASANDNSEAVSD